VAPSYSQGTFDLGDLDAFLINLDVLSLSAFLQEHVSLRPDGVHHFNKQIATKQGEE
jgi:hypothetical protein